ncbi:FAD-dependent oxidoreductase [Affinibrenneria salicis]|uniref:FAD-dependent oxidoreductase n=1 Tax=Affinibrenneria salicis TaxID=2590031 RepID=A0A5J5G7P1_9GAMM|nr:FAD-dependent oxidoreductase [Affinibrenneria salicis]KAA9002495.1 FAD-dependent oxidoreductase [Affinibrenneria salicis]KAA9003217.1 FAD-dependent oxidoreductase [Affinibrenneria salicis]
MTSYSNPDAFVNVKPYPFWLDTIAGEAAAPALQARISCDLAIVGGGYTGLWTALLARRRWPEKKIVIIEAKHCGSEASSRNGGFCSPSISHGTSIAIKRWPQETEKLIALGRANLDELEADLDAYGMQIEFERTGQLNLASHPWQLEGLRSMQQEYQRFGIACEWLEGASLTDKFNSSFYRAGLFEPNYALVNPAKMVSELRRVCLAQGVELYENSAVTALKQQGQNILLRTSSGEAVAGQVVLATNIAVPLLRHLASTVIPVYDYAIVSNPLSERQLEAIGWVGRYGISDSGNRFHYFRKTADNRILWGGYDAIYHFGSRRDESLTQRPETFNRLAEQFSEVFPAIRDIGFSHAWGGIIDTSARTTMFTGCEADGRIAYALGFTGLGVSACRFAALNMLDQLAGEKTARTELRMTSRAPVHFPPEPLRFAGVQAAIRSLAREDRDGHRNVLLKTFDALGIGFDS